MHTYVFISYLTLFCRTLIVLRVHVIKDDVMVIFVEIKSEIVTRFYLVVLGKLYYLQDEPLK
jgi:hypothetical protein